MSKTDLSFVWAALFVAYAAGPLTLVHGDAANNFAVNFAQNTFVVSVTQTWGVDVDAYVSRSTSHELLVGSAANNLYEPLLESQWQPVRITMDDDYAEVLASSSCASFVDVGMHDDMFYDVDGTYLHMLTDSQTPMPGIEINGESYPSLDKAIDALLEPLTP